MNVEFLRRSFCALLVITSVAAAAQRVPQAEIDKALEYLESTKESVLEATGGLSEAQWNFKPAPDRWVRGAGHGAYRRFRRLHS